MNYFGAWLFSFEAAIKAIKDGMHGYTPSNGIIELREAVSKHILEKYKTNR